jgi:fluoride exporter
MIVLLVVAVGGAVGAMGRLAVSSWSNQRFHHSPIGTLIVNVSGALALGIFVGLGDNHLDFSTETYRLVVTGILGSYTTFSTLFYETITLVQTEKRNLALIYAAGSQVVGLIAVFAGLGVTGLW